MRLLLFLLFALPQSTYRLFACETRRDRNIAKRRIPFVTGLLSAGQSIFGNSAGGTELRRTGCQDNDG
jgi:hypothetical protein